MKQKLASKNKPKAPVVKTPTSPTTKYKKLSSLIIYIQIRPKREARKWDDVINRDEKAALNYSKKPERTENEV
jgi:hypothetical protein